MMKPIPLVVDLDGTLLKSDLLFESAAAFARRKPLQVFRMVGWLLKSRAHLKSKLAEKARLDVKMLPYDSMVLAWLREEKAKGRPLVLATASTRMLAEQVAAHLDLFDEVIATDEQNLKGTAKRDELVKRYGAKGFDYAGNEAADLPIWGAAERAYVVNATAWVEEEAQEAGNVESIMHTRLAQFPALMRAMRPYQWVKNLLIFVPLLAGHQILQLQQVEHGLIAFLLFGLCASSVYILNDLLDLQDDRHHVLKRYRPFAKGDLSIAFGVFLFPLLLAISFIGAWLLSWKFAATLLVYYVLTLSYSLRLKRMMIVDVIVLTSLYTLRIIAGTFVFESVLTFWLLAFSMFIFLSLALVKRYSELREARKEGRNVKTPGRGYHTDDLEMIASLGASSGYLSVMVLALYIQDPATTALYHSPKIIWLACPLLLFWISRIWMLSHRGVLHDDPVIFAIKDKVSLAVGALFGLIFWMAT